MSERHATGGRIVAAREAKGLTLRRAARRLGVSPRALRGWERGRTDVPLPVRQAMAALYGTAPQYLVPERPAAVERDGASAVIRIGSVTLMLQHTDDDTLRTFLAAVREERGLAPGAPMAIRESDAALLADVLGGSADEISRSLQRLLGLKENEAVELGRWLFGRTAVAGVLALGLTAGVAATAFAATAAPGATPAGSAPAAASASPPQAAVQHPDDPNWAEIGDAAVLWRDQAPTDSAP
jgi:transcriptional regulator with XRE-family HTH domain